MSAQDVEKETPFLPLLKLGLRIQHLNQKMETETGISLTQWSLLNYLIHNPTISALALSQSLGIQPGTLTQSLKRLERKGLILVVRDPLDGRRKLLSATRTGYEALAKTSRQITLWERSARLSPAPILELFNALTPLL